MSAAEQSGLHLPLIMHEKSCAGLCLLSTATAILFSIPLYHREGRLGPSADALGTKSCVHATSWSGSLSNRGHVQKLCKSSSTTPGQNEQKGLVSLCISATRALGQQAPHSTVSNALALSILLILLRVFKLFSVVAQSIPCSIPMPLWCLLALCSWIWFEASTMAYMTTLSDLDWLPCPLTYKLLSLSLHIL